MNKSKTILFAFVLIILVFVGLVVLAPMVRIIPYSSVTANWEIATGTSRIVVNGQSFDLDSDEVPFDGYVGSYKSYIKLDDSGYALEENLKYGGTTGIQVSVGNPVHITKNAFSNEWYIVGDETPFRTYEKYVGDLIYKYRHDVYRVDVEMRTDGALKDYGWGVLGTCEGLPDGGGAVPIDHYANTRVFFGFIAQAWDIVGDVIPIEGSDATYKISSSWSGIMSASILDIPFMGAVPGSSADPQYSGEIDATNTVGTPINMYDAVGYPTGLTLSGSAADTQPLGSITGVPSLVMLEVASKLEPGMKIVKDVLGSWISATPVDNYITYSVRIDVLSRGSGYLVSGEQPTFSEPTNIEPAPIPDTPWWELLFGGIGSFIGSIFSNPIVMIIFVAVIAVIVLVIFLRVMLMKRVVGGIFGQ